MQPWRKQEMHALTKMLESTTIIASALNSTTFSPFGSEIYPS